MKSKLSISAVEKKTGVSQHTLRYYERAGLLMPVTKDASGHRLYSEYDLEWIEILKVLRNTGMPIRKVRQLIKLAHQGDSTLQDRIDFYTTYKSELEAQIKLRQEALLVIEQKIIKHSKAHNRDQHET